MSDEIIIDSEPYISSKRASELMDYTQDYIGQLSRSGQIKARRVGGLWYVSTDSLRNYKEKADSYKPEPPVQEQAGEPDSLISFDGRDYISAARAAKITGYTADYVGQLARARTILGRQVGNRWYVERTGILAHKREKDALLGAVQVESVGLRHKELEIEKLASINYAGAGPFLDYSNDERGLIPDLRAKFDPVNEDVERERAIPIHVMPARPIGQEYEGDEEATGTVYYDEREQENLRTGVGRVSGKAIYTLVLPVVMTIVIVLSFSFFSLKNSSVYTRNNQVEDTGTQMASVVEAVDTGVASSSGAEMLIDSVAGYIEQLLVPEIVYQKEN